MAEQVPVQPLIAYAIKADDFRCRSVTCGLAAEILQRLAEVKRSLADLRPGEAT